TISGLPSPRALTRGPLAMTTRLEWGRATVVREVRQPPSFRSPFSGRVDLDGCGHAGDQANAIGDLIDFDADRHALSEADPGEHRVDVREPLLIGVCIRDVDGPRDAAHVAANNLAMAHQFELCGIAFVDGGQLSFLEIGVDPKGVGIDNRD